MGRARTRGLKKLMPPFYQQPGEDLARALIGKILAHRVGGRELRGRIVETEAYLGPPDLASHSSKGRTKRTEIMFGRAAKQDKEFVSLNPGDWIVQNARITDMSIGVTYRGPGGPTGLGKTVEVYAKAFPDMHRELYRFFSVGNVVVVELASRVRTRGPYRRLWESFHQRASGLTRRAVTSFVS